jgi:hypothetical protein
MTEDEKKITRSFAIDRELDEYIVKSAKKEGRSVSSYIGFLIQKDSEAKGKGKK